MQFSEDFAPTLQRFVTCNAIAYPKDGRSESYLFLNNGFAEQVMCMSHKHVEVVNNKWLHKFKTNY